ncbi:MAG: hypothetical protein QOJ03_1994 [Frankiaceae bacterium]|nr:hypothetical protein [Frankiaceae bacterium]
MPATLAELLKRQDGILRRAQVLEHLSEDALRHRLGGQWQVVLPGVYAAFTGRVSEEQRLQAAVLYAGTTARLTDVTMLRRHGVRYLPSDDKVHVIIDWEARRQSRAFVHIRRTKFLPPVLMTNRLPGCSVERSLADFGSRWQDRRVVLAVFADAVQRRMADWGRLERAVAHAPRRRLTQSVMDELRAGIRSAPEADFRTIAAASNVPEPLYNALIELPSGRLISPDALVVDSGTVHETNGRVSHAEEDLFESMQERHDAMTAAGLAVLHNSPRRLQREPAAVRLEWEQCHQLYAGRGLPAGVTIIRESADPSSGTPLAS